MKSFTIRSLIDKFNSLPLKSKIIISLFYIFIGLIPFQYQLTYNFISGEKHIYGADKEKNPLPQGVTEASYLKLLENGPDKTLIIDIRNGNTLPNDKMGKFANSVYNFNDQNKVNHYLLKNKDSLKDKNIVFLCYGGFEARIFQKNTINFLRENNINLNIQGFESSLMLGHHPAWQVVRMQYLPETVIPKWEAINQIKTIKVPKEINEKTKLMLTDSPSHRTLIETSLSPEYLEEKIYPTSGNRFYPISNWKTPPKFLVDIVFFIENSGMAKTFTLKIFSLYLIIQGLFRFLKIRHFTKFSREGFLRMAFNICFILFIYYASFCFIENFYYLEPPHIPYAMEFLLFFLFMFRFSYKSEQVSKIIYKLKNKGPMKFQVSNIFRKFSMILVFPILFAISNILIIDSWAPHYNFNNTFTYMIMAMLVTTPIIDWFLYLYFKYRKRRPLVGNSL